MSELLSHIIIKTIIDVFMSNFMSNKTISKKITFDNFLVYVKPPTKMELKILLIFLIIRLTSADLREVNTDQYLKERNIVDSYGSMNVAIDFEFLQRGTERNYDPYNLINQLRNVNLFTVTVNFIELYDEKAVIEVQGISSKLQLKYSPVAFDINLSFLKNETCTKKLTTTVWKVESETPFCIIMFACFANRTEEKGIHLIAERLIFIVDKNHNLSAINDYIYNQEKPYNWRQEGFFCMCNFFEIVLNDSSKVKHGISIHFPFFIFLTFFLTAYVFFEVYSFVIKTKDEEKLLKKIISIRG